MGKLSSFLGTLQSASLQKVTSLISPYNKKVIMLCKTLEDLGYIYGFTILKKKKVKVFLKYYSNKPVLRAARMVSRGSSRIYYRKKNLKGLNVNSYIKKNAFVILTTSNSKFYLTDIECQLHSVGGEPICVVS